MQLHPTNANIAYVAAAGNLWKADPERGVFKTTDGGKTWTKVLYVDTLTGATDLVMDPRDPNVLYAATYQRLRSAFGFNGGGPGSAIYKTTDGGATWKKLENGIPPGDKGRIAFSHLAVQSQRSHRARRASTESGTYRTEDAGATWKKHESLESAADVLQRAVHRSHQRQARLGARRHIFKSEDGGVTFEDMPNVARVRRRSQDRPPHDVDRPARLAPHARRRRRRDERELGSRA